MHHRGTAVKAAILVVLAGLAVAGCGSASSGSENPTTLLQQTFTGTHKVTSGVLNLQLTIDPSGSTTFTGPITVSFGGPFQTRGSGKLPASNFTVSASALGRSVALGILSTGTNDKTIRRLTIGLTVPVTGSLSSQTGGVRSADLGLTVQYANLNQPQTITAPTSVRPYSEFQAKVAAFAHQLQGATSGLLGSGATSSGGGSAGGGSSSSSGGTSTSVQQYSQCIQQAASDVGKMQKCSSLLGSGG